MSNVTTGLAKEALDKAVEIERLKAENAKLREQMERLVTLLRADCDIEASWDGLRRFWSIELTEGGCLMRDRACKAEAENAKLRKLLADVHEALCLDKTSLFREAIIKSLENDMRELGIDVDA